MFSKNNILPLVKFVVLRMKLLIKIALPAVDKAITKSYIVN